MFVCSFLLTVLPLLTETHAFSPPHRHIERSQLHFPGQKIAKREATMSFLFKIPLHQLFHHLIFHLNCCSQTSCHSLRRNSTIPLPQEPTNAITHLQLNGEGKNG
jgi:hypothetical protein